MYPNQQGYPNQPNPNTGFGFNYDNNSGVPYPTGGYGMPDPNQSSFPPYGGAQPYGGAPQYGNPQPGYPQSQPGYPQSQPGYPQSQPGYPPSQQGYPHSQPDYSQSQPGYPSAGPSYPTQPSYNNQSGYPQQQGYSGAQNYPSQPAYGGSAYPPQYDPNSSGSFPPYQPGPPPATNNPSINNFYPPTAPNQYPPANPGYNPPAAPYNSHGAYPTNPIHENPSLYPSLNPGSQMNANYNNFGAVPHFEGTLKPYAPFNPMDDATKLYKAMKGFGTDETVLIDILCRRTYNQRQEIAMNFKTGFGKDLLENIKSETKGNFELVFKALLKSPAQLEAHDLKKAIDGGGTDEEALIDVMCTKTNAEMIELKNAYKQMYHKDLERDVGGDVSGYFKRLLVSLACAHRSENPPDINKAVQQANELYAAGAKMMGTDEVTFNRIFASESFPHLKVVFDEYYKKSGNDIEKAVKSEMSGYVEKAFLALVNTARNPSAYYAQRLYDAMSGAGTKDRTLVRIIALRCEKDMVQIKSEFQRRYGKTLESYIKSDCTGDYERALRCLIGDPNWR